MEMVMETVINQMMDENKARTKNEIQGEMFCYAALYPTDTEVKQDVLPSIHPLMAYKATSDPGYMYLHQAIREPRTVLSYHVSGKCGEKGISSH